MTTIAKFTVSRLQWKPHILWSQAALTGKLTMSNLQCGEGIKILLLGRSVGRLMNWWIHVSSTCVGLMTQGSSSTSERMLVCLCHYPQMKSDRPGQHLLVQEGDQGAWVCLSTRRPVRLTNNSWMTHSGSLKEAQEQTLSREAGKNQEKENRNLTFVGLWCSIPEMLLSQEFFTQIFHLATDMTMWEIYIKFL